MNILSHLRKSLRTHRQQLSREAVTDASVAVAKKILLLSEFQKAKHTAFYAAQENEIDLSIIFHKALALNQSLYLPVFSEQNTRCLSFYRIDRQTTYVKNQFSIDEPVINHEKIMPPEQLDVIFLPLVAFDAQCHRVGRGAGCYDRCLGFTLQTPKNKRPILIGLAYEFQKVEKLIPESWDVPMDYVATEEQLYQCRPR